MVKNVKKFFFSISAVLLALPLLAAAQVQVDPNEPVPVPYIPAFGAGPAGRSTASGLIVSIIDIVLVFTGLLAVLFLIIGGLRYITAHGNEEQGEAAKKTITHAIIGLVIVILSFVIVRVISNALIFGKLTG